MENLTIPPTGAESNPTDDAADKSKRKRVSFDEWIAKFRLAFTNAQLPEILPILQTVGYDEEKLKALQKEVDHLVLLGQSQKKEYGEQYEESQKFDSLRTEIDSTFRSHRALMKIILKNNLKGQTTLALGETVKTAYAKWEQQVDNFYSQIKSLPEFAAEAQKVSITPEIASAMLDKLLRLRALKKNHQKELGEAQDATEARDTAFDALMPKYRELMDFAKVLLSNNQHLEALGMVVKR